MEVILAAGNAHKAAEFSQLFDETILKVKAAAEKVEVVEDGTSFQENAFKKASAYFAKFKRPTIADDSGLCIPARADLLGIHSARYAAHLESYEDKNNHLIEELKELVGIEREAYFVCYICLYISPEEVYSFEGRVHGVISDKRLGSKGFGYDPIFLPKGQQGKSLAEIPEWKMQHSHRAKAARSCEQFVRGYENHRQNP